MPNNHSISLGEAVEMTRRYRNEKDNIVKPECTNLLPICETFDRTAFEELLAETDCKEIRCYLGMDKDKIVRLIIVGVNDQDEDILPPAAGAVIMEDGKHCPPICPLPGPLNS